MVLLINIQLVLETLILGILASSIVAVAVELWKRRSKKYHISVTLDSSDVYSSLTGEDVNIRVDYKGGTVENSLVILRFTITNDGKEDIMFKSHFSDAIKIKSKGYKFLSVNSEDDKIKPECSITGEGAILSWDILKSGERIQLYIAAQSEQSATSRIDRVDIYNSLSFEFRSDCLDSIEPSHEMTTKDAIKRRVYNGVILKYVYMAFICVMFVIFDMSFSSRYDISYEGLTYKNSSLLYTPLFKRYVLSSDSAKAKILKQDDVQSFDSIVPSNPVNLANGISWSLELIILLVIFMSFTFIMINRVRYSRYKKGFKKKPGSKRKA